MLSDSRLAVLAECMRAFGSIQFSVELKQRLGPPLMRIAIESLRLGHAVLDDACLHLVKVLVSSSWVGVDEKDSKETILHSSLASLCASPIPSTVSVPMLQACVIVFSQLTFESPNPTVYAAMAAMFEGAIENSKQEPQAYKVAVGCLRALLESSFRAREEKQVFFQQCVRLLGSLGGSFVAACCKATTVKGEEELKLLVYIQAVAGVFNQQGAILEIILPAFVSLLDPDTGKEPHAAALAVVMSLAQNAAQAPLFKAAAAKLDPSRLDTLQRSLKRKAEQDAAIAQAEARKEKQLASQKEKINFGGWGK